MTIDSLQGMSHAPTTDTLIDLATSLGISVCWRPPRDHRQAAYALDARTIWLRRDLTTVEAKCLLAHELAHAVYGDDGDQPPAVEARAWRWAAQTLISAAGYAAAEDAVGPSVPALAEQLHVTREVIEAYQSTLPIRSTA